MKILLYYVGGVIVLATLESFCSVDRALHDGGYDKLIINRKRNVC